MLRTVEAVELLLEAVLAACEEAGREAEEEPTEPLEAGVTLILVSSSCTAQHEGISFVSLTIHFQRLMQGFGPNWHLFQLLAAAWYSFTHDCPVSTHMCGHIERFSMSWSLESFTGGARPGTSRPIALNR
jgi:hypothetical protein